MGVFVILGYKRRGYIYRSGKVRMGKGCLVLKYIQLLHANAMMSMMHYKSPFFPSMILVFNTMRSYRPSNCDNN